MKNIYLFQPQYAVEIRKETNYWLPYSAGCLWSYAQQFDWVRENFKLAEIIFRRQDPVEVIERMIDPVFCGFSCYMWNKNYCLRIAEMVKEKWPSCVVVFGGPEASPKILENKCIDSIVISEGENHFVDILKSILEGNPLDEIYAKTRLDKLDIPSPYLTGVFEDMINAYPGAVWAMTFETNRGCPYHCTFCDWGGLTHSKVKKFELEKVAAELDWAANRPISYMYLTDANFGIFKERDLEIAKLIRLAADRGQIEKVNITYAKNSTDIIFEIAAVLGDLSKGITLSLQSAHDDTLEAIKRKNMDINNIQHMLETGAAKNIGTYSEFIIGLPLETLETWKQGFDHVLEMGQHNALEVWPCQLLENTELISFESKIKYGIKSVLAQDYMPYHNADDHTDIVENILLVTQTNTMSKDDMVEGFVYGWMIMLFHYQGYTKLTSQWAREIHNIAYRKFYDRLYELIHTDPFFAPLVDYLKVNIKHYLDNGYFIDQQMAGHTITYTHHKLVYENKGMAYALAQQCAATFTDDTNEIDRLQQLALYDPDLALPMDIVVPWDILSWADVPTAYTISTNLVIDQDLDFYIARRTGVLYNIFAKTSN
jgi:radical SAM superfamily enzyme YgiQ (UPF0313 family)